MDDLKKILIFRTDRLGDFILTNEAILSLKNSLNCSLDIVCSKKNISYIKKFKYFNEHYVFDGNYLYFFLKYKKILLKKYDYIFIYDGKKRSHVISFFLRGKKFSLVKSKGLYRIAKLFNYKVYFNNENFNQLDNFNFLNLHVGVKNCKNFFYKNFDFDKSLSLKNNYKNSVVLHLDEKWFKDYFYKDFDYFDFDKKTFNALFETVSEKKIEKFIITTGGIKIKNIDQFKNESFFKINDNEYIHKKYSNIYFLSNLTFTQLENFLCENCKTLISCHGGVSHLAHNLKIYNYEFIQSGREKFYYHWSAHMKKIKRFARPSNSEEFLDIVRNLQL